MPTGHTLAAPASGGGITPRTVHHALTRLEDVFLRTTHAEALLARREAGRPLPDDARRAQQLVEEIRSAQNPNGAWDGSLITTAETLILLDEILPPDTDPDNDATVAHGVAWLRSRRGAPGRYSEGCSADRHREGLCHHFLGGFFAPTPPADTPRQGLALDCGAIFAPGPAAQLVASCRALRATLTWGTYENDDRLHLEGLHRILAVELRETSRLPAPLEVLPEILMALLAAPSNSSNVEMIRDGMTRLIRSQRADGSWPEFEIFHILDVLLTAVDKGYIDHEIDAALARAAEQLIIAQQEHGSWGRDPLTRRSRIGWRTLRYVAQSVR